MTANTTPFGVGSRDVSAAEEKLRDYVLEVAVDETTFGLRLTDTADGRNKASVLINKMYAWRGYSGSHHVSADPNRITLTASIEEEIMGTLTLGIDSSAGILADTIFKDEIDRHRARGARVCEVTKLAFDPRVNSKEMMALLFHLAMLHARDIHGCTDLFIEVNPRHRRFYEHMLGFDRHSGPRINPRVNAPAYLLRIGFDYVAQQIQSLGGKRRVHGGKRSLYPMFFSPHEEQGIVLRLREMR